MRESIARHFFFFLPLNDFSTSGQADCYHHFRTDYSWRKSNVSFPSHTGITNRGYFSPMPPTPKLFTFNFRTRTDKERDDDDDCTISTPNSNSAPLSD